ncbi:hypothetical protein THAOC_29763, partial [Thalassiosira oceanica]
PCLPIQGFSGALNTQPVVQKDLTEDVCPTKSTKSPEEYED